MPGQGGHRVDRLGHRPAVWACSAVSPFFSRFARTAIPLKGASAAKTFAQVHEASRETLLDRLGRVPVLFQERIAGPDVRVHTVGDQAFGEAIHSPEIDYRMVARVNDYRPIALPDSVVRGCTRLTAHTGLPLLGVDFKIDEATGEWYFLEANAMPCFEGYDRRAGGAITAAMADWLAPAGAR
ncbi:hypothetical protein ACFXKR_21540 [Streptomyces violascens]|uniref:hypothetical protein n=1 Tax=Streptomyces violascens TaxID=67381 RepID=UPI00368E7854